jgi:hypothetical protein
LELEKRTVLQKKKPSYIYTGDATIDADRAQDAVMALPLPRLTRIESNRRTYIKNHSNEGGKRGRKIGPHVT